MLLVAPSFAFPLEKRVQHKEDEQIKRRILLQSTAADGEATYSIVTTLFLLNASLSSSRESELFTYIRITHFSG